MNIKKEFKRYFPKRSRDSHKGDYGRVLIVAGSKGLSGACVMTSLAALRSGAGLVTVGVPKSLTLPLTKRLTEAMMLSLPETKSGTLARSAFPMISEFLNGEDVLAIGPGLSTIKETQEVIRKIVLASKKPMVIDADGLNAWKGRTSLLKDMKSQAVLTPHAGEFVRLFGGKIPKTTADREKRAAQVASEFSVILVLKGHETVVASPEGKIYINETGNPGMATGGTGDILTGIIAAFLGQKLDPFMAASFGVFIHGFAGDLAAKSKGEISLIATDLITALPTAYKKLQGS